AEPVHRSPPDADATLSASHVRRQILDAGRAEAGEIAPHEVDSGLLVGQLRGVEAEPVRGERVLRATVPLTLVRDVDEGNARGEVPPGGTHDDLGLGPAPCGARRGGRR